MDHSSQEDLVILELEDPAVAEEKLVQEEISISTLDISSWDLPPILRSRVVKVHANRSRLILQSSYFRGLLGGSFSESSLDHVSVRWNRETVVTVLQFIYGCSINVTLNNFISLLEGSIFFGAEELLLKCETWFHKIAFADGHSLQISLDTILEIWNFGLERGLTFTQEICEYYLARKFAWVISSNSFIDIAYDLLHSCIQHPQLTVDSEKQLCEALLIWLSRNSNFSECSTLNSRNHYFDILKKVRIYLLPLDFVAGQRRHLSKFADETVGAIVTLMKDYPSSLLNAVTTDSLGNFRFRLTEYSEKIVLSGCAHMTVGFLFLATFTYDRDCGLRERPVNALVELDQFGGGNVLDLKWSFNILPFEAVREVDISRCPKVHFGAAVKWLHLAFPSLTILKASHSRDFKMEYLFYLMRKCPQINEVDLRVDISPVVSSTLSVLSVSTEVYKHSSNSSHNMFEDGFAFSYIAKLKLDKPWSASIAKLTLEGRTDISDLDLLNISALSEPLSYLNIRGCTLVTDIAISKLLCECSYVSSIILSYTSFGQHSIQALCSANMSCDGSHGVYQGHKYSSSTAFKLQQLEIDGCKDVDENFMRQLMSHLFMVKILSLKETSLIDDGLFEFMGSSLESLNVSETKVSMQGLAHIIRRNHGVKHLKMTGCRHLHQHESASLTPCAGRNHEDPVFKLGEKCILEEVALGWGFSLIAQEKQEHTFRKLRSITIGLGASLGQHALCALPKICPLLETVNLIFQVVSDDVVRSILESLKHLKVFGLSCCLGELTSFSFRISMPTLRTLRLEWVAPWFTNSELSILTQNCSSLIELSLSGCKLLDSDSQKIISSGWPGMTVLHLEDCGKITSNGVPFLFQCKALEDLLLRHNGRGIRKNFILDAVSKLPLLRKLALDICDACEEGFDSPSHTERFFLSTLTISCCKSQTCGFKATEAFKPVHKKTIVVEWKQHDVRTTVVKERV